jgi:hypothetical protein
MTPTQQWIEFSSQAYRHTWGKHLDERRWQELGVAKGAFWDLSDAAAAWRAMRWVLMQQPLGEMDMQEQWRQFVRSRVTTLRALTRRALDVDAFRHPNHATNAFQKLRREGPRDRDLLDAWEQEIQDRLLRRLPAPTALSA